MTTNISAKISISLATIALIGLPILLPIPTLGQTIITKQQTKQNVSNVDAEIEKLNQQISQLYQQSQYQQAIPLAEQAVKLQEQAKGTDNPDVALSLNNLALLYKALGNYPQALSLYQRALTIQEKNLNPQEPAIADTLNNLGVLYSDQGNYSEAESLLKRALSIRENAYGQGNPAIASVLNDLGLLYSTQGKYNLAEPLLQRALNILETAKGQDDPQVANTLNYLGNLYRVQANYTKAESLYQRSLSIQEKAFGTEHPVIAFTLNDLGTVYSEQEKYAQAEPLFQRALKILEKSFGTEHPTVAATLNNLATLYSEQGKYSQAEPLFQRSIAILEKVYGANHPDVAININNLATVYLDQGNYAQAEPLFQRSLTILEKTKGSEHPLVATTLYNLAKLAHAQGNIPQAIQYLTRCTNIEEKNISLVLSTGSETQKREYMATLADTTDWTISLHLQNAPNNPEAARLALTTILRRKGRILDALTESLQTLRANLTPEDQKTLDRLAVIRSQLSTLIFTGAGSSSVEADQQKIASLKAEAENLEEILSRRSAQFRNQSQPVTIEAVQKLIPSDAALVELVVYKPFDPKAKKKGNSGTPHYAAYILHPQGEAKWVDLGEASKMDQAIVAFRKSIKAQSNTVQQTGRTLDELLFRPVRQLIGNTPKILLSPDSQLNLMPFAALVDENNQYLLEKYSLTYLTSGRDLLRLCYKQANEPPDPAKNCYPVGQTPLIIANPDYDNPGNSRSVQVATSNRSGDSQRALNIASLKVGALPGTAAEAVAISPMLPGVTVLSRSDATENALKKVQAPRIVHVATHGFFLESIRNENPLLVSGLALAGFNPRQSGDDDGVLTALEAAGLNLRGTKLVVLSACETGLGEVANGEGVYGLRRAFLIAGAESQVISLWTVDDFGTKELMTGFYKRLTQAQPEARGEALREIQLEMLRNPRYAHPFFWAAFIPSGDWRVMEFDLW